MCLNISNFSQLLILNPFSMFLISVTFIICTITLVLNVKGEVYKWRTYVYYKNTRSSCVIILAGSLKTDEELQIFLRKDAGQISFRLKL